MSVNKVLKAHKNGGSSELVRTANTGSEEVAGGHQLPQSDMEEHGSQKQKPTAHMNGGSSGLVRRDFSGLWMQGGKM